MRPEKKYLVDEVSGYLGKSDYVFLADYRKVTVADAAELRASLRSQQAEYHVVKNSILNVACRERKLPELESSWLVGQTAIVVGGRNPSEVAKILTKYFKDKEKLALKGGVLGQSRLSAADVDALSKLPSLDTLRAQLLGLLSQPGTSFVRVLQGVPQGLLNVLQAKSEAAPAAGKRLRGVEPPRRDAAARRYATAGVPRAVRGGAPSGRSHGGSRARGQREARDENQGHWPEAFDPRHAL